MQLQKIFVNNTFAKQTLFFLLTDRRLLQGRNAILVLTLMVPLKMTSRYTYLFVTHFRNLKLSMCSHYQTVAELHVPDYIRRPQLVQEKYRFRL